MYQFVFVPNSAQISKVPVFVDALGLVQVAASGEDIIGVARSFDSGTAALGRLHFE